MVPYRVTALALLALRAIGVAASAESAAEEVVHQEQVVSLNLAVAIVAKFPEAEHFGIKVVNGRPTKAILDVTNNEAGPVTISVVGGALSSLKTLPAGAQPWTAIARNLTSHKSNVLIPAGGQESIPYQFLVDMHPADLRLQLIAVVSDAKGVVYQVQAFNETVSVVEAPTNIFHPQTLFLYSVLLAAFTSIMYWIYKTWIETLFPQTKKHGKGGERARRSLAGSKKAVPIEEQLSVIGGDGPAVTNRDLAQKAYDESWLPEGHTNRPAARRVKSGASGKRISK